MIKVTQIDSRCNRLFIHSQGNIQKETDTETGKCVFSQQHSLDPTLSF